MFYLSPSFDYLLKGFFLFPTSLFLLSCFNPASAQPCYPTDPTGSNLGNLCLQYPNPSINQNMYIQAKPLPIRALPSASSPAGTIMIHPRSGSYWSEIRTQGGGRSIQNNVGDKIFIKK